MIKRLLVFLILSAAAFGTTTVSGNVKNLGTGAVSKSTFVRFWLRGCSGNQPRVNGTAIIAPSQGNVFYFDVVPNSSGVLSGTLYSTRDAAGTGNGEIECGGVFTGVWYGMQLFVNGKGGPETPIHAKNTATIDVSNVSAIATNPVVTAPTGDTTYARLDAGNQPFTGPIQAPSALFTSFGKYTETTSPVCALGFDFIWGDSTAHRLKECDNNGAAVQIVHSGVDINTSDQVTATHLAAALPIAQGGTGQATAAAAFNALNPMTTLGDIIFESAANTASRLAGNTTTTKQYLSQTGTGAVSAAPAWAQIAAADLSDGNTGTGAIVHTNSPAVTSPTINTGVAQGSGVKHQRFGATCTTAATAGASCTTTETWTVAFADANYTVTCTGNTSVNAPTGISVEAVTAANFVVRIFAVTATASGYSGVNCIAFHD